jgi:hypothetical protein
MQHERRGTLIEFEFESRLGPLDQEALALLVGSAWRANLLARITGRLRLSGARIHQVMEGDITEILPIAARILRDPRHASVEIVAFGAIDRRRFEDWRVEGLAAAPRPLPAEQAAWRGSAVAFEPVRRTA